MLRTSWRARETDSAKTKAKPFLLTTGSFITRRPSDAESWGVYVEKFFIPTLLGNITGGVSLVAFLGHAQVVAGKNADKSAEPSFLFTKTSGSARNLSGL